MPFVFWKGTCVYQLSTFLLYLQMSCPWQYLDPNCLRKDLLHLYPQKIIQGVSLEFRSPVFTRFMRENILSTLAFVKGMMTDY